jgi:hypothetical protein
MKVLVNYQARWAQEIPSIGFQICYHPELHTGNPDAFLRRSEPGLQKGGVGSTDTDGSTQKIVRIKLF